MTSTSALHAAVVQHLEHEGAARAAAIAGGAEVELVGSERWSMGSREVQAARVALVVGAAEHVALQRDATLLAQLRGAFAAALRTPETDLAELFVVLRLPVLQVGWHRAYRDAPAASPERPSEGAVLAGARALLDAEGDAPGADLLGRASLETAPSSSGLCRGVLRFAAADFARLRRDPGLGARLSEAVRAAATRVDEALSLELALALPGESARASRGARDAFALEARIEVDLATAPASDRELRAVAWRGYLLALREEGALSAEEEARIARALPPSPEGAIPAAEPE